MFTSEAAIRTLAVGLSDLATVLVTAYVAHVNEGRIEDDLVVVNLLTGDDEAEGLDEEFATA